MTQKTLSYLKHFEILVPCCFVRGIAVCIYSWVTFVLQYSALLKCLILKINPKLEV